MVLWRLWLGSLNPSPGGCADHACNVISWQKEQVVKDTDVSSSPASGPQCFLTLCKPLASLSLACEPCFAFHIAQAIFSPSVLLYMSTPFSGKSLLLGLFCHLLLLKSPERGMPCKDHTTVARAKERKEN